VSRIVRGTCTACGNAAHECECERSREWWADNESENGLYGVYECREDGDHGKTVVVVASVEEAERIVREHNATLPGGSSPCS